MNNLKLVIDNSPEQAETKPDGTIPGDNWLSKLPEHTTFLVQDKKSTGFVVGCMEVLVQYGDYAVLQQTYTDMPVWVDTALFSAQNRKCKIIHQPEIKQKEQEVDHDGNRTHQSD